MTDQTGAVIRYGYDAANRLTSAATGATAYGYSYDGAGNRLTVTRAGQPTTFYGYDNANQLCWSGPTAGSQGASTCPATPSGDTTYTSDADGNQTAAGTQTYAYNPKNQTSTITMSGSPVAFDYADADHTQRVSAGPTSFVNSLLGLTRQTASFTFGCTRAPNGKVLAPT